MVTNQMLVSLTVPRKWIEDVNDTQHTDLKFPILADANLSIARMYDMIHPQQSETAAVRSVFIIDPDMRIRLTMTYPMSVGRNFVEILRVIDQGRRSRQTLPSRVDHTASLFADDQSRLTRFDRAQGD